LSDVPEQVRTRDEDAVLAQAVRDYVSGHPSAMDTVEGIAEWWIPGNIRPFTTEVLKRVLDRLTAEGVLNRIRRGAQVHYRAARP
jgi:hypothetical protein